MNFSISNLNDFVISYEARFDNSIPRVYWVVFDVIEYGFTQKENCTNYP